MNVTLDHSVLHVTNWERSNRFYKDVLGAEVIDLGGKFVYRFGTNQLNLHGPGLAATPLARIPVPPGGSDLCFVWPALIASAVEHLNQLGVQIELGPVKRFGAQGDGLSVYFRDPDGSLLELISYQK
jgi:catechol 2,3-dioxygenase-like lactoylglutathione lyase family enzyme